ncbi:hypothetical protein I4U23_010209 [Adineta vaga]|nr:hypothetical protein I4U23_010209 [Adineta vaga]
MLVHEILVKIENKFYPRYQRWIIDYVGTIIIQGESESNLADLNVYGILTAIQGTEAFQDLMNNTKIQPWFERMKHLVEPHFVDNRIQATT